MKIWGPKRGWPTWGVSRAEGMDLGSQHLEIGLSCEPNCILLGPPSQSLITAGFRHDLKSWEIAHSGKTLATQAEGSKLDP